MNSIDSKSSENFNYNDLNQNDQFINKLERDV
jgi:hypothetical protein